IGPGLAHGGPQIAADEDGVTGVLTGQASESTMRIVGRGARLESGQERPFLVLAQASAVPELELQERRKHPVHLSGGRATGPRHQRRSGCVERRPGGEDRGARGNRWWLSRELRPGWTLAEPSGLERAEVPDQRILRKPRLPPIERLRN